MPRSRATWVAWVVLLAVVIGVAAWLFMRGGDTSQQPTATPTLATTTSAPPSTTPSAPTPSVTVDKKSQCTQDEAVLLERMTGFVKEWYLLLPSERTTESKLKRLQPYLTDGFIARRPFTVMSDTPPDQWRIDQSITMKGELVDEATVVCTPGYPDVATVVGTVSTWQEDGNSNPIDSSGLREAISATWWYVDGEWRVNAVEN